MREDGRDIEASYKKSDFVSAAGQEDGVFSHTWAFDIHEVRVGGLYETLQLMLLRLGLSRGVEEIDGERLFDAT